MKVLDCFAGIGGFAIAAKWAGFETAQFVEIDPFCQKVLTKNFPHVPIHDDITTFTPADRYDIITAGFPCQDISSANPNGRGLEGERSGLFFRVVDIIRHVQPQFVLLENVAALLNSRDGRDMGIVLRELSLCGYDAEWQLISASSLGAPHRRNRVFIIAYPSGERLERGEWGGVCRKERQLQPPNNNRANTPTPHPQSIGQTGHHSDKAGANSAGICGSSWWEERPHPKPTIRRVDDGLSRGLDTGKRLKALGNSVTPQQALIPMLRIKQLMQGQS